MKQNDKINNNKSYIFARIRSHHYGESQSFSTIDAALTWVQQTSRELVEAGYTSVTYTIQGECHGNQYQGHTNNSQYCDCQYDDNTQRIKKEDNNKQAKEKMEETKNSLTTEFFCTAESEILKIAANTMNAAISSKELSDNEFDAAIADASNGLVTIHRSIKNPNRVDFCDWNAYTTTHAPRDPGKKPLTAIEQTIIDTYRRGTSETSASVESDNNSFIPSINNVLTSDYQDNTPAAELLNSIVSAILVRIYQNDYVKHYLRYNRCSLDEELSIQTGGIITCSISSNSITLGSIAGITSSIATENRSLIDIDTEVRAILIRMLIQAALSAKTRDAVARIINLEELGDMVYRL